MIHCIIFSTEKSVAGYTLFNEENNNIGISTADKLYELSQLDEQKAIELIEEASYF